MKVAIITNHKDGSPISVVGKMAGHEDLSDRGVCFVFDDGISFTTMEAFIAKMPSGVSAEHINFLRGPDYAPVGCLERPILPVMTEYDNSLVMYFSKDESGDLVMAGVAAGPVFDLDPGIVMEMSGSGNVKGFEVSSVIPCMAAGDALNEIEVTREFSEDSEPSF